MIVLLWPKWPKRETLESSRLAESELAASGPRYCVADIRSAPLRPDVRGERFRANTVVDRSLLALPYNCLSARAPIRAGRPRELFLSGNPSSSSDARPVPIVRASFFVHAGRTDSQMPHETLPATLQSRRQPPYHSYRRSRSRRPPRLRDIVLPLTRRGLGP